MSQVKDGEAQRFELFYAGQEIANGYVELIGKEAHIRHFERQNLLREKSGKKPYPLDDDFLNYVENLPECCGVSVGFDRLMMLRLQKKDIQSILTASPTFEQWEAFSPY